MGASPETPYTLEFSRRTTYGIIIALIGAIAGAVNVYLDSQPADVKNYGLEVGALQRQYVSITKQLADIKENVDWNKQQHVGINLRLQSMDTNDNACQARAERIEHKIDNHLSLSVRKINEYDVALARIKVLVDECRRGIVR